MKGEADWSRLHGDLPVTPLVRYYLRAIDPLATALARTRVHPDVMTLLGVVAAAVAVGVPMRLAAVAIGVSALLDALDGAVALRQGRPSAWGHLLDSLADRVSEWLFLAAMVSAGAPAALAVACAGVIVLLEYARARAGSVGVVTVGERPVRVLLPMVGLLSGAVTWALVALSVVTVLGLGQLMLVLRRQLGGRPAR